MPAITGPNIVNNGLVLALDAANIQSFKGEPTTNIAAGGGLVGMSGISLTDLGIEDGWRKYGMSGTFTGGGYPYIMHISGSTFTGGVLYSSKCIVKTNVDFKFNYFGANGLSYVNEPMNNSGTLSSIENLDESYTIARIGFAYTDTTNQPGYLFTNPINNTSFNASTDFVYIKELQVEQKAYATPFVNGTRGTTVATGGGWADQSGEGGHGELENGPIFGDANFGSIIFDGVNDIIGISNNAANNISGNITLDCWINRTSNTQGVIIHKEVQYTLIIRDNGSISYADSSLWSYAAFGNHGSVSLNTFNHIVATKSGSLVTIYLNGNVVISKDHGSALTQTNNELYLGAYDGSSNFFSGQIAKVRVYNRALSAAEVLQNYNATKGRFGL